MTTTPPIRGDRHDGTPVRSQRDASAPVRVLCVGPPDEGVVASSLAAASTDPPIAVETADTGTRALDRLTSGGDEVACLVTEYEVGSMTGLDLLAAVRVHDPDLPVVLLTDDGNERLASEAISAGVTDYFRRSVVADGVEPLADRITTAVSNYRTRDAVTRGSLAMETAQDGISLLDEEGCFVYLNQAYADIYGYDRERLLGAHWELLYPDDQVQQVYEDIAPALERTGSWSGQTTGLRADGSTFPEQHSLARTAEGGYACVVRDVSEVRAQARALREREQALRDLTNVVASTEYSTREKVDRIPELGCERFDTGIGMFTDRQGDRIEVVRMHGSHPDIEPGMALPPSTEHYCREVIESDGTVATADAEAAGWSDDALYEDCDLACYAGTQLTTGDGAGGTVCFVDVEPRAAEFTDAEHTFLELLAQCLGYELERNRREAQLTALNELARGLMDAESAERVSEAVVDTAATRLDLPVTALALYDQERGVLDPAAATDPAGDLLDVAETVSVGDSIGWRAFVDGESRLEQLPPPVVDRLDAAVSEVVALPLGDHGVLVTGTTRPGGFRASTMEIVETVAATARASLDRAARERELQARERSLAEKNDAPERLSRVNDTIRSIDRALVSASSRAGIEAVVCEELAGAGAYELAWIGEADSLGDRVRPRESAGDDAFPDEVADTTSDGGDPDDPVVRAAASGDPVVVDDVLDADASGPWRRAALDRGYHACIALPLVYQDSPYGVLVVYADRPGLFDDFERAVLVELSDTIAHAINAAESKRALVTDEVVELVFDIGDTDVATVRLAAATDCTITMESVVPTADGSFRGYFTVRGDDPTAVRDHTGSLPVTSITLLSTHEDGDETVAVYETTLTDESLLSTLVDHGAIPQELTAGDDDRTVVHLGDDAATREFVEMVTAQHPEAELLAQRTRDNRTRTARETYATIAEVLTERQLEVRRTAYHSGYFEQPRDRTGSEIAGSLGITQPTFNHHLRTAQRKLCRVLLDSDSLSRPGDLTDD